ncbi:MAG: hypothetical protein FWH42_01445 [Dehalococcoidia bacterium]|nr:hypothetical protein [Dehalococcoidia bacterium]
MDKQSLCFPLTDGLIKSWFEEKVCKPSMSTEYTWLVLNRCTCGFCSKKQVDFTAEYEALLQKIQTIPYAIRAKAKDVEICKLQNSMLVAIPAKGKD